MARKLGGAVVVITGASSGIGRAAARAFAARGAKVAVAARRADMLEEVAAECRAAGGEALAVTADVTEPEAMERLARETIDAFGRIDVWVNNAGIIMFGRLDETPVEDWRRLIEINLLGVAWGARAVLPHFRARGRGVLINVGSIDSYIGQTFASAYVASKYAVRGLSVALRQELSDTPGVRVCTLLPPIIDTPGWQHAANYSGQAYAAPPPVYDAETVAAATVDLAERPRRELAVGVVGKLAVAQYRATPALTERVVDLFTRKGVLSRRPAAATSGALFRPGDDRLGSSGGWQRANRPLYAAAGTLLLLGGLLAVGRSRRRRASF